LINILLLLFFVTDKIIYLPSGLFFKHFMRKISIAFLAGSIAICLSVSCKLTYQPQSVQFKDYRLNQNSKQDSSVITLIRPYADSVNKSMNAVVAVSEMELEKKQPEGTLGNILADAMLSMAEKSYATHVDAAFINYGGIRLPSIPAGNITLGKIFELAPFDNLLILQKISGKTLQEFLDHIAGRKGWPCAGITMQIKDKKAVNVMIGGKPINESATYTIANNDYVANGGDDCVMLKPIPQVSNGYLFRDAVIDYFTQYTREGKKISVKIENRVTNAE
jgi:2',3'-cyclic-nucleotide 2'-phosphodiesterase (5'-nucleotidase family)